MCNADGTCADPACDDAVQNGDETDVDCGGSCAGCDDGSACTLDGDCVSGRCADGSCAPALLATGEDCTADEECESGTCRAFGAASICTETCETTCPGGGLACFEGFCTPADYCDDPDGDGFGRGPGCTGTVCDACASTATCSELPGGDFECLCNTGYSGDGLTCTDDDECTLGTDSCDANAACTNTDGAFTCACNAGYSGDGTTCADVDECTAGTDSCDANAACTNTDGAFTCACNAGYSGDGTTCTDVDECAAGTDTCDANAACTNITGGFSCACNAGYSGDGMTCTDVDECTAGTDTCDANAACTNITGAFTCACNAGYSGDGMTCTDVDECTLGTDTCDTNAACTNITGGFSCACNAGYSGDGMTCTDVDECTLGTDTCDTNAACTNTSGGFSCACNSGFVGDGMTCTDVDECTLGTDTCDTNAACTNTSGGFSCACNSGFVGDGMTCTDVDECTLGTDDCHALATCTNTPGSFTCACPADAAGDGRTCTYFGSCRALLTARPSTPTGDYTIDTGTGGPVLVHCDMDSDGGAGYTMVRFDDASLTSPQSVYRGFCAARGMEVIVPRTRAHALAIRAWNGGAPPNLVNVFPESNGATGLMNWEGRCGGAPCEFWISNSNNGGCLGFEPNGDNNTGDALYLINGGVCDYGHWNDANGVMSVTGHVICSTNDAGPPVAASCNDILTNESVQNVGPTGIDGVYTIDPDGAGGDASFDVYCDMTTAGGGWTLITVNGTNGRPTSFTGNAYPRPGASFYGSVATAATDIVAIRGGVATGANYSVDAAALYAISGREVLAFVGGATRDYIRTTLPSSCNFFDGSTTCEENVYTGLTISRSDGAVLTTTGQACTTANRTGVWSADPFDEFGLHLLDGLESSSTLHCHQTPSPLGHQNIGRLYSTYESADGSYWNAGVHSHWNESGTFNIAGYLMLR